MDLTIIAMWLNSVFASFDYAILEALHNFAVSTNGTVTPFFALVSLVAENGIGFILLALVLMLFKKTRKIGICVLLAVGCGALITNVILKDIIARLRPFGDTASVYYNWWQFVGATAESSYSFPSGHVTATMAAMTALFLSCNKKNKKISWTAFILVILMCLSRNYLMVHYPSDVLGGIVVGVVGAIAAFYIAKMIYQACEKNPERKLNKLILQFDVRNESHFPVSRSTK